VGPIIYQNLVYLKNTLQYSTIILNSQNDTFESLINDMLVDFINRGHLVKEKKDDLKRIILTQHCSRLPGISDDAIPNSNPNDNHNKKQTDIISELFASDWKQSKMSKNFSFAGSMALTKKSSTNFLSRSNRHLPGEAINLNSINEDVKSLFVLISKKNYGWS
jgi:hypothetical protein